MVISNRSEYPVSSGFPSGLETLIIHGCSLKRVELRILRLSRLVKLDLSNNCLSSLPDDWSGLNCLAELRLMRNKLACLPRSVFSGNRVVTLTYIDVCENELIELPSNIVDLSNLAVLKLDSNKLTSLPHGIGRLHRLVQLSAANNLLDVLPGDIKELRLQTVDLFGNPLSAGVPTESTRLGFAREQLPSLFELAARCIRNNRLVELLSNC